MSTERRLTEPQRKALFWLVPGQVCGDAPSTVSAALRSLRSYHPDLVTSSYKHTPRGRIFLAYELTEAGVAERAARIDQTETTP
jgi:hypothetical protein